MMVNIRGLTACTCAMAAASWTRCFGSSSYIMTRVAGDELQSITPYYTRQHSCIVRHRCREDRQLWTVPLPSEYVQDNLHSARAMSLHDVRVPICCRMQANIMPVTVRTSWISWRHIGQDFGALDCWYSLAQDLHREAKAMSLEKARSSANPVNNHCLPVGHSCSTQRLTCKRICARLCRAGSRRWPRTPGR